MSTTAPHPGSVTHPATDERLTLAALGLPPLADDDPPHVWQLDSTAPISGRAARTFGWESCTDAAARQAGRGPRLARVTPAARSTAAARRADILSRAALSIGRTTWSTRNRERVEEPPPAHWYPLAAQAAHAAAWRALVERHNAERAAA